MFSVAKKILVMINLRFRLSCRMAGALQISFVFYFFIFDILVLVADDCIGNRSYRVYR